MLAEKHGAHNVHVFDSVAHGEADSDFQAQLFLTNLP